MYIWYAGYNYNLYKGEIVESYSQVHSSIKQKFSFSLKGKRTDARDFNRAEERLASDVLQK